MERKQMGPDFMEHGVLVSMRISLAMFYVLLKTCYCVVRTVFLFRGPSCPEIPEISKVS